MGLLDRIRSQRKLFALIRNTIRHKPDDLDTVADLLEERAAAHPDRVFLHFEDRTLTYGELDREANRVAHWALSEGIGRGDRVALLLQNRPEYLVVVLGLAKVGTVTALLNTHIGGRALAHALEVAGARHRVVGAECADRLAEVQAGETVVWTLPDGEEPALDGTRDLAAALASAPATPPPSGCRDGLRKGDDLLYIFTSGTTGLPKAARMSHMRFLSHGDAMSAVTGYGPDDVVYCALPLYHGAGGVVVPSTAMRAGAAVALRRSFSAGSFWDDCRRYGVTGFHYVGELCRYLLNRPPRPEDRDHRVRIAVGAGLGPDIWSPFQDRFGIERIVESYGSTEGNTSLINLDGKRGSVGRIPFRALHNARLVRWDVEAGELRRDGRGFLVECAPGEVGELLGRIPASETQGAGRFEGYTDDAASERKILRDVFRAGDAWFRTPGPARGRPHGPDGGWLRARDPDPTPIATSGHPASSIMSSARTNWAVYWGDSTRRRSQGQASPGEPSSIVVRARASRVGA